MEEKPGSVFGGRETSGRLTTLRESEIGRDLVLTSFSAVCGNLITKTVTRRRLSRLIRSFTNSRVEIRWLRPGKGINTTSAFFILDIHLISVTVFSIVLLMFLLFK